MLSVMFGLIGGLVGCGGAQAARDKLSRADSLLSSMRKLKCPHRSIGLAERAYARSRQLLDEGRYDEAARHADVARAHAKEAQESIKRNPCEVEEKPQPDPTPEVTPVAEDYQADENVDPYTAHEEDNLQTVFFEFDSFSLNAEARGVVDANLEWIRAHPNVKLSLEGHCDQRGTREYNLALGDKRAQSVVRYLEDAGIHPSRIGFTSFGSDMPISHIDSAEGHRQNRRVEFKVARSVNAGE